MPTQLISIDDEITYILNNWVQNSTQRITGTIGQNVVWNLAMFIKQLPENFTGAKIIATSNINYTTNSDDCIIIFNNNSKGGIDWVGNRWNKYVIINATDNVRSIINSKFYIDINGVSISAIAPRSSVTIVKGNDGIWYQSASASTGTTGVNIIGIAGRGRPYDPVIGTSIYEYSGLINKGGADGFYEIYINSVRMQNYGSNPNFVVVNPAVGLIDISPLQFDVYSNISYNI